MKPTNPSNQAQVALKHLRQPTLPIQPVISGCLSQNEINPQPLEQPLNTKYGSELLFALVPPNYLLCGKPMYKKIRPVIWM